MWPCSGIVLGKLATDSHTACRDRHAHERASWATLSVFTRGARQTRSRPGHDIRPCAGGGRVGAGGERGSGWPRLPGEIHGVHARPPTRAKGPRRARPAAPHRHGAGLRERRGTRAAMARVASVLPAGQPWCASSLAAWASTSFLKDLLEHFDERADDLACNAWAKMAALAVPRREPHRVSFAGGDADFARYLESRRRAGRLSGRRAGRCGCQRAAPAGRATRFPRRRRATRRSSCPPTWCYAACGLRPPSARRAVLGRVARSRAARAVVRLPVERRCA